MSGHVTFLVDDYGLNSMGHISSKNYFADDLEKCRVEQFTTVVTLPDTIATTDPRALQFIREQAASAFAKDLLDSGCVEVGESERDIVRGETKIALHMKALTRKPT